MLRDRYDPINLFEQIPAWSLETDPVLTQLDTLLDDDELFHRVKQDLARRFPRTSSFGRPSTPVEVILRMLVIKHLYHWSYTQAEQWVSDSLVLRQFCRVYAACAGRDHPATLGQPDPAWDPAAAAGSCRRSGAAESGDPWPQAAPR